ncbi:hypothetical protein F4809DRAFT_654755 [Biscogniauxia mediterranea]|nr:hypothetical protein F4809DRAFT_654755 [Biscogniauxia mediterranea]
MAHSRGLLTAISFFLFITLASPRIPPPPVGLAALDDAAFAPNFAPRWRMGAMPASPALEKRQGTAASPCAAGQHSCLELGAIGAQACCDNDRYCIVNSTWQVQCCAVGSSCDPVCDEERFLCNTTTTSSITQTTIPATATATTTGDPASAAVETVIPLPVTSAGCCSRACNTSQLLCAPAFGGQCCPLGATCASGGACVVPPPGATATTSSVSTRVTEVPEGCTTSQITCASADGGGCCDVGSTCTWQQRTSSTAEPVCAPNLTTVAGGGSGSAALSSSARAGIGAGVAAGAALVIAALTWLCLRRRRHHRAGTAAVSEGGPGGGAVGMRHLDRDAYADGDGDGYGGSESLVARAYGRARNRMTMTTSAGGGGGGGGGRPLSDSSAGPGSAVYRDGGGGHDYFGPDAVAGPYTEDANTGAAAPAAIIMMSPGGGAADRGVPVMPMDPDDIVPPVEIDSRIRGLSIGSRNEEIEREMMMAAKKKSIGGGGAGVPTPERGVARRVEGAGTGEAAARESEEQGPFELYGSPPGSPPLVSPPMSPDYFSRQAMSPSPEMGSRYSGER